MYRHENISNIYHFLDLIHIYACLHQFHLKVSMTSKKYPFRQNKEKLKLTSHSLRYQHNPRDMATRKTVKCKIKMQQRY